jgi:EmrB/QacA subfamily drug resistance transporter
VPTGWCSATSRSGAWRRRPTAAASRAATSSSASCGAPTRYLISFGGFLLVAGRLGDLAGRKRVFLCGLVLFTAASALCGFAQAQAVLIPARFVQGIGGAATSSVVLALIVIEFSEAGDRARAMAAYMFVNMGGASLGLLAGGVLTEALDWHWIFFVNVPIGVAAFAFGARLIDTDKGIGFGDGVDVLGSLLVTAGLLVGVYAIVGAADHGWGSVHTLGLGAVGLALLAAFLAVEARVASPIMPLGILRLRSLIDTGVVRAVLGCGMWSVFFIGALYLERVRGFSAVETGLAFLPLTLGVAVMSAGITRRLMERIGAARTVMAGLGPALASLLVLSRVEADGAYLPIVLGGYLLAGIGAGMTFMPLLTLAMAEVPARDAGLAAGIANVSLQVGAAVGLAALATFSTSHSHALRAAGDSPLQALTGGYQLAFLLGAACLALALPLVRYRLAPARH